MAPKLRFQKPAADINASLMLFRFDPMFDLGLRPGGTDKFQPVLMRRLVRRCENFDRVTARYGMLQWNDFPIDLGPDAVISNLGMNRVGEIDGRGSLGQFLDHAFGSEHIDDIMEQVQFDRVHELAVVRQILVPFARTGATS